VIGHHEFKERLARAKTFSELVTTFMPGSTGGRTKRRGRARGVHDAEAADAHGSLVLQMTKCGDVDAFMRAASKTLVPAGTRTGWPSRVMSIIPEV